MDVKLRSRSAWFCSLALTLSLSNVSLTTAEEAIASDTEVASTIFISDDSANEPPGPPQSGEGSVVFIEDTAEADVSAIRPATPVRPASATPVQSAAQGELKVVMNQTRQVSLEAVRPTDVPQPLVPITEQPVAPPMTIQPVAVAEPVEQKPPIDREQPGDIEIAIHAEPLATIQAPQVKTLKPYEELLILAHKLSLEAKSIEDYTQIIDACDEAIQFGAKADKRQFARQLSSWAFNRRGQMHADIGEQDLSAADFQAALELNPRNWRAMHNRGVSFAQQGQFAEAFDDFNRVVQLNPRYAKAYANRATLYVQAKDLHSATKDYELAIQQDNQFATAYVGLGRVCHMLGRWDDAIESFNAAVEIEPNSPDIVCSRGDLQADMGNYGRALTDYARTIELDSEFAHAYRNGAWLLATCPDEEFRDPDNAVLGAQQALEYSYGDRHVALDTLAAAYASNGQFEEAVATLNQAVEIAPQEAKLAYLARLELYQANEPFRTEPVGDVTQAAYEE